MRKLIIAAALLSASPALAFTCRGEVIPGTLDSAIGDCSVLSKSAAARQIFQTCKMGDLCEVAATVKTTDGDSWIQTVQTVKLIERAK